MKALSVRQPYVFDIACGIKTIELRSRPTKHRGELLICSSKGGAALWFYDEAKGIYYKMPAGAQICVVEVVGCRPAVPDDAEAAACEPEDIVEGMWAWELKFKRLLKPNKPVQGKLNLFEVPDGEIADTDDPTPDYHLRCQEHSEKIPRGNVIIVPC